MRGTRPRFSRNGLPSHILLALAVNLNADIHRQMKVLVIGGAGYIGSHTARVLRKHGHEAIIYDNLSTGYESLAKGFELITGDIADTAKLRPVMNRVDAVMHF